MAGQGQHGDGPVRRDRATVGWLWRALAAVIVAGRYLILLAWIAAAVAVTLYLPPLTASDGVGGLIPSGAPALRAEYDAARLFGLPLTAQVAVVQRDPRRFPLPCVAGLVLAGLGLRHIKLGFPLIRALPATSQEVRAEQAAAKGFVPGILVPALVVLFGRVGSWPGRTVPPVRRLAASPAAEDLHGTVAHRD